MKLLYIFISFIYILMPPIIIPGVRARTCKPHVHLSADRGECRTDNLGARRGQQVESPSRFGFLDRSYQ